MRETKSETDLSFRQVLRTSPMDFWRLWYVGLVVSTVRWLETVVMGIVVYQQTGSALIVAMVTMLRLVPMGLFGAFLGAFAERFDRRLTLAGVVGLMTVTSALLAVVAFAGTESSRQRFALGALFTLVENGGERRWCSILVCCRLNHTTLCAVSGGAREASGAARRRSGPGV